MQGTIRIRLTIAEIGWPLSNRPSGGMKGMSRSLLK
jgi:hypothetical protein